MAFLAPALWMATAKRKLQEQKIYDLVTFEEKTCAPDLATRGLRIEAVQWPDSEYVIIICNNGHTMKVYSGTPIYTVICEECTGVKIPSELSTDEKSETIDNEAMEITSLSQASDEEPPAITEEPSIAPDNDDPSSVIPAIAEEPSIALDNNDLSSVIPAIAEEPSIALDNNDLSSVIPAIAEEPSIALNNNDLSSVTPAIAEEPSIAPKNTMKFVVVNNMVKIIEVNPAVDIVFLASRDKQVARFNKIISTRRAKIISIREIPNPGLEESFLTFRLLCMVCHEFDISIHNVLANFWCPTCCPSGSYTARNIELKDNQAFYCGPPSRSKSFQRHRIERFAAFNSIVAECGATIVHVPDDSKQRFTFRLKNSAVVSENMHAVISGKSPHFQKLSNGSQVDLSTLSGFRGLTMLRDTNLDKTRKSYVKDTVMTASLAENQNT
jgi:hypothetical protein